MKGSLENRFGEKFRKAFCSSGDLFVNFGKRIDLSKLLLPILILILSNIVVSDHFSRVLGSDLYGIGAKSIHLSAAQITEVNLRKLEKNPNIEKIVLRNAIIDFSLFEVLSSFQRLTFLRLENIIFEAGQFDEINKLTGLASLQLRYTPMSENIVRNIASLTNLELLEVSYQPFTNRMLTMLNNLQHLKTLILKGCQVTDEQMLLLQIKDLDQLDLSFTDITGKFLRDEQNSSFRQLTKLNLNHSRTSDSEIIYLSQYKNLRALDISDTLVTDIGVPGIKKIKNLNHLLVDNLKLSKKSIEELIQIKELQKLSINGAGIEYNDLMFFRENKPEIAIVADYLISNLFGVDVKRPLDFRNKDFRARFILKEPIIIGMSVPFEIILLNDHTQPEQNPISFEYLIFKVKNNEFDLYIGGDRYSGTESIRIPVNEGVIQNGSLYGEISLQKLVSGQKIEIYSDNGKERKLLTEGRLDAFNMKVAGVLFPTTISEVVAGQELNIAAKLVDFTGAPFIRRSGHAFNLNIEGPGRLEINNKKTSKILNIKPVDYNDKFFLKLSGKKAGSYIIRFDNKIYYGIKRSGYSWNTYRFNIIPDQLVNSKFQFPDKIEANQEFTFRRIDTDQYDNQVISDDFTNISFPDEALAFVKINQVPLKEKTVQLNSIVDKISFEKAGEFKLFFKGLGGLVSGKIKVLKTIGE